MRILVFILLCLIWGFSWVAIKFSLEGIPPFLGAGLRFLIAVPLLYTYLRIRKIPVAVSARAYKVVVATAVLIYGIDYGFVYWAEQYLSAGVTAILFATFPFFTAIFSHFVVRSETLGLNVYLGLFFGFGGVVATFSDELLAASLERTVFWATAAVIVSAMAGALATVLTKKYLTTVDPGSLTLNQTFLGSALLVTIAVVRGETDDATWVPEALFGLAYLGVFGSALAFTLFYWLLQRMSAVKLATMIYILPVVAVFSEWFLFGELLTINTLAGMLLIFIGIAIAEFPKYRPQWSRR